MEVMWCKLVVHTSLAFTLLGIVNIEPSHEVPILTVQSSPQLVHPSPRNSSSSTSKQHNSVASVDVFDYELELTPQAYHLVSMNQSTFDAYPNGSYFVVVGMHTYARNITLCHHGKLVLSSTSLGLVLLGGNRSSSGHTICLYNPNASVLRVLVIATVYPDGLPIPGGCNAEFELEMSPYLRVYAHDRLLVNCLLFQRASLGNERHSLKRACGGASRRYDYRIYAHSYFANKARKSKQSDEDDHFRMITQMSSHDFVQHGARMAKVIENGHLLFRLWFIANQGQRVYFNIAVVDRRANAPAPAGGVTLYVPSRVDFEYGGTLFEHWLLWLLIAIMTIASVLVSAVGYRNFLFVMAHYQAWFSSRPLLAMCLVLGPSSVLALGWTCMCRASANLKLALSVHSLVLSIWLALFVMEVMVLLQCQWMAALLTVYFDTILLVATVMLHIIMFHWIDLFWLSALSTSVVSVYFVLLPVDLFYGASLFRLMLNIWLYNEFQEHLAFFNLTLMSANDVVTYLLFIFLVMLTITWQLWSKVGNGHYGFACIVQPNEMGTGCVGQAAAYPLEEKACTDDHNMPRPLEAEMLQREQDVLQDGKQPERRKTFAFQLDCKRRQKRKTTAKKMRKMMTSSRRKAYRCRYCNKRSDRGVSRQAAPRSLTARDRGGGGDDNDSRRHQHQLQSTMPEMEECEDARTESTYIDYISRMGDARSTVIEY